MSSKRKYKLIVLMKLIRNCLGGLGAGETGHEDAFGREGEKLNLDTVSFLPRVHMSGFTEWYMLGVIACMCYASIKQSPFSIPHTPSGLSPELSFSLFLHLVGLYACLALISSYKDASQMR